MFKKFMKAYLKRLKEGVVIILVLIVVGISMAGVGYILHLISEYSKILGVIIIVILAMLTAALIITSCDTSWKYDE